MPDGPPRSGDLLPEIPPPWRPGQEPAPHGRRPPDPSWVQPAGRTVLLVGRLDAGAAQALAARVMDLDAEPGSDPVELHVATRVADLDAALLLADVVGATAAPVLAVGRGVVGGAALAPFAAASRRVASRRTLFQFAEPSLHVDVPHGLGLPAVAEEFAARVAALHAWVAGAAGRSSDAVADDFRRGRSLDAAEALTYGLLDELRDAPDGRASRTRP